MDVAVDTTQVLPGDEERTMLRDAVRGFLAQNWPAAGAVERARDPAALAAIWQGLAEQGIAALGAEPSEGGLRELVIVMEALGAAGCPAPMLGAALANLCLTGVAAAEGLLAALHRGDARVAFCFAGADPDPGVGSVRRAADGLHATLRCVEAGSTATHFLVVVGDDTIAIVARDAAGVVCRPTRAFGTDGLGELVLAAAAGTSIVVGRDRLADARRIARVCLVARAVGAARRGFDLVVAYAKERKQFGAPIGRFQAIQHKLANCWIALEGAQLTMQNAATAYDRGEAHWRYFAAASFAYASTALRQVSLETHHAFGAIGYAEEHEAPRHFRRVHMDMIALGGTYAARTDLAGELIDNVRGVPEYDLGAAGNAFRAEVRAWLEANWSGSRKAEYEDRPYHDREYSHDFAADLGRTGWIGLGWPREFGGQARSAVEQNAYVEAMERGDAPRNGVPIQASAMMLFGTQAQQAKYLPEILNGLAMHGMGYSEPGSGSDLASLRTRATRDGDEWVINGEKIWTTTYWGKYLFVAARTDPAASPPHAGISMFVVPSDHPGLTIRPSKTMYDGAFANCFYDDVRLPADALVGPLHGGWKVLTSALATERGVIGTVIIMKVVRLFEMLLEQVTASGLGEDPLVRDRLATLAAEIEVGRQLATHCATVATADGRTPPEWGAIAKVFAGELFERFGEAVMDLLGQRASLSQHAAGGLAAGRFEQALRHSMMWVISIGTNEIQRSLIAQRGLGLPR
jgi:alkylation response protein AidB-like acyl-CoA dehydrogenase